MSRTATNKVHVVSREIESKELPMFPKEPRGELTEDMKIDNIRYHFECIMKTLGLDLSDRSLRGTPERVARMYVKEIFSGLLEKYRTSRLIFDRPITLVPGKYATCAFPTIGVK